MSFNLVYLIIPLLLITSSNVFSQNSDRFRFGVQLELSIDPPNKRKLDSDRILDGYNKGFQQEYGIFAIAKLSRRLNLLGSIDARILKHLTLGFDTREIQIMNQEFRQTDFWELEYRSFCFAQSIGLNYEIFKFAEFDIVGFIIFNPNFKISHSDEYEYFISRFTDSSSESNFSRSNDIGEIPDYVIDDYFGKYECGVGLKFDKLHYEIIISRSNENLGSKDTNIGLRIKYVILNNSGR